MRKRWLHLCVVAVWVAPLSHGQNPDITNDLKNDLKGQLDERPKPPPTVPSTGKGPTRLQPPGAYTHAFTGVEFPLRVGNFSRSTVDRYDAEGRDIGVTYRKMAGGGAVVNVTTVFSYPLPPRLASGGVRAVFDDARSAIVANKKNARLVRDGTYRAPDGSSALYAEYAYQMVTGKKESPVRSLLYLFESEGWLLEFRVTYLDSRARDGAAETESFMRTFGTVVLRKKLGV